MGSKIYEKAPIETENMAYAIMREVHHELDTAGVRVAITLVSKLGPEDELVPCLKLRGTPCVAYIRTIRLQQKVYLEYDAEIMIDNFRWRDMPDDRRKAVLDHELTHLELCKDKRGAAKLDDQGRPKLRLKPDDYALTGFMDIVSRHGSNSVEWRAISAVYATANEVFTTWEGQRVESTLTNGMTVTISPEQHDTTTSLQLQAAAQPTP